METEIIAAIASPVPWTAVRAQGIDGGPASGDPNGSKGAPTKSQTAPPAATNGCILIVDDNESVRETLADILEIANFHAIQAGDAAQALMILRDRTDVDVLVTDLSMPGADGIMLIRQARLMYPEIPAILLTGYAEEATSISSIAGGNFHVLRKPVESDRLIEQLLLLIPRARPAEA